MTIGDLRDHVSVVKPSQAQDGQGGRVVTWIDLVTGSVSPLTRFWANVAPVTARESLSAAAIAAEVSYFVTLRYRADLDETMRVRWTPYLASAPKTLEIHGVVPYEGERVFSVLWCSEA